MGKKQVVAELLYDLPTGRISTDTIRWVMSHLPDEDSKGDNSQTPSNFKHDADELHEALGLSDKDILSLGVKVNNTLRTKANKSRTMEVLYPLLSDAERMFIITLGMDKFQDFVAKFVPKKFGVKGVETLLGDDLSEEEKEKLRSFVEVQNAIKKLKDLMGDE